MKKVNYNKIAKKVIAVEIAALKKLNKSFDNSFLKAVNLISKCKGKIILAGIGKSGLISKKISATLSSVGTPSFFLSPGDAAHGDLGQVTNKDILLILSYSGETEELKNIIQYANRFGIPIIGVASKKDSLLLRASNVKVVLPAVKEAGSFIPGSIKSSIGFGNLFVTLIYLIAMVFLGFHLRHGFQSAIQTFGIKHTKMGRFVVRLSILFWLLIPLGFFSIAFWFGILGGSVK